jgi:hypothetical protein
MRVAQAVQKQGQFAMELKVRHCRRLLPQMLETSHDVHPVQRALEWQMRIDAIHDLTEGIQNIQPFTP